MLAPDELSAPDELMSLVTTGNRSRPLLRKGLERSGFFGARFRECAGRALLITRGGPNARMPLWLTRLKSQKLLQAVMNYKEFPVLLEAWRACLQDEFDMPALQQMLSEIESGAIRYTPARTEALSPMAQTVAWRQVNTYMYKTDEPRFAKRSKLREDLLRDVVFTPGLRPAVPVAVVNEFERKRMRLHPGYAPQKARDLLDWVKERVAIPWPEWEALLAAVRRDQGDEPEPVVEELRDKLVRIIPPDAADPLVAALETAPRILRCSRPPVSSRSATWPATRFREVTTSKESSSPCARPGTRRAR